jgi:hypothetical protein
MNLLTKLTLSLILAFALITNASATTIKLNDSIELGVLSLDESFTSFYDYNPTKKDYSSHTGYEANNSFVMFFAEYNNTLALFALADSPNSRGKGKAEFRIENMTDFGSIIFKDDSGDKSVTDGVNWAWASKKNDGLIFQLDDANNFDLDIKISNASGLGRGYKFLSFDEDKQVTTHQVSNNLNVATIPEPSTLAILGLALVGLASSRRKK